MRGRKPQPTAIKIAKGTRRDRVNLNEPKADKTKPNPPAWVKGEALKEWKRIIPLLDEMGVLAKIDGTAIALYCLSIGRIVRAQKELDQTSSRLVCESQRGGPRSSPLLKVVREESAFATRLLSEFGATPVSRTRLTVNNLDTGDELDAFLRKGNG